MGRNANGGLRIVFEKADRVISCFPECYLQLSQFKMCLRVPVVCWLLERRVKVIHPPNNVNLHKGVCGKADKLAPCRLVYRGASQAGNFYNGTSCIEYQGVILY